MPDLADAFGYGAKDVTNMMIGGAVILVGAILLLIVVGLIPLFVMTGYLLRVAETTIKRGAKVPPEWDNIGDLLVKGIMAVIIWSVYLLIIPAGVFLLFADWGLFSALDSSDPATITAAMEGMALAIVAAGIIDIIMWFPCMVGIMRYAETGSVREAFAIGKIINELKAKLMEYVGACIVLMATGAVVGVITTFLKIVIGLLLSPFILFYYMVMYYRMLAKIYAKT